MFGSDGCCGGRTKLAVAKVFFLVLLPLAVCLPVWLKTSPAVAGESALLFFMLVPHVIYPIIWIVLIARDKFNAEVSEGRHPSTACVHVLIFMPSTTVPAHTNPRHVPCTPPFFLTNAVFPTFKKGKEIEKKSLEVPYIRIVHYMHHEWKDGRSVRAWRRSSRAVLF